MQTLKLGGVPEHFNFPIHQVLASNWAMHQNFAFEWHDIPQGTGRMMEALDNGEMDCCIALTEGSVKHIASKKTCVILAGYVKSPLVWGVHVGQKSKISEVSLTDQSHFAISRYGSGSHLMPKVHALGSGVALDDQQFNVIDTLGGALEYLHSEPDTYFYWEKTTTQPFVDKGYCRRIGEFPTPWPCFVFVVKKSLSEEKLNSLKELVEEVYKTTKCIKSTPYIASQISSQYSLQLSEVQDWLGRTEWYDDYSLSENTLQGIKKTMLKTGILTDREEDYTFMNV